MKVVLTALNAKYIHTNLAVRYLKKSAEDLVDHIEIAEFTINHSQHYILNEIYKMQPEIVCFSCYIWNIEMIHQISKLLKKVMPQVMIVLGGPEVSFETVKVMEENDAIDIVVIGEGEKTFRQLMAAMQRDEDYSEILSIAFRAKGKVFMNEISSSAIPMEEVPFGYNEEILDSDKIVYYESSRGCPFHCQYCLSSSFTGVRFRPIEMVKEELKFFIDQEVKQVKFVDRTFNTKKSYAMEIMQYIVEHNRGKTNFHFEVTADLMEEDMLEFLQKVPVGLFQFEIGVQSTNGDTLEAIQRKMNFSRLKEVVKRVASGRNIHQHLDLIVGLPKEDYFSFRKSFDDVFSLRPEKLQVGFLKLLKGSGLRRDAIEYGYIYDDSPPYEVLENDHIAYGEIMSLKGIEEMVETYWNTRMFSAAIEAIISSFYTSSFKFFEDLWRYWEGLGYQHQAHSRNKLYEILIDFYEYKSFVNIEAFKDLLKLDYIKHNKTSSIPKFFAIVEEAGFKDHCHKFLQQPENLQQYLPQYVDLPAKQIIKKVHFQQFNYNVAKLEEKPEDLKHIVEERIVLLFDYDIDNKAIDHCRYFLLDTIET
ncbi:putative cobalamin (vitamin B12)-dependent methylthiotransferase [Clostridium aceticum]|uniref:Putative cobalamin (Vitamin B12)-dependent methylthiotransferase n=1 Tax=Clostridium aceticum TaxID=84022 RepID=A0A0D8IDQ4_9CLOT|nr:B12-binding domain-containing radical SAM protein [Clostridium aceticum]AKL94565.1 putative cobalamin (vitamin B12)-dependent methylthiotransferase [Clostridium aceticum]KJF28234.1 radical SAM protein [Clostridium aceticum]